MSPQKRHREVTMLPHVGPSCASPPRTRTLSKRALALALLAISAVVAALVAGCSSGSATAVGGGSHPGTGTQLDGGSCLRDEPGCACKHEGQVIACGMELHDQDAGKGVVKCNMGGQICSGGHWSICETNSNDPALQTSDGLKLVSGVKLKGLTDPAVACSNKCDPYCLRYPDTPADASGPDAGTSILGCGDAAVLTVVTNGNPEASVPPPAVLADADIPDGEGHVYLILGPNQTTTREFTTPAATIKAADIYFLIQDTSSMGPAASSLASALTNTTSGIIASIKTALSGVNPNFGVGRFEDYYYVPYVGYESHANPPKSSGCGFSNNSPSAECPNEYDLPFQHLLSMQTDTGAYTAQAVNWLTYDSFAVAPPTPITPFNEYIARGGGDFPEASVSALWMIATGNGLSLTGVAGDQSGPANFPVSGHSLAWWQVPRQYWTGSSVGQASQGTGAIPNTGYSVPLVDQYNPGAPTPIPCPAGSLTNTYPCFRSGSTPVIVLLGDAPAHQGPGGQYPYVNELYAGANSPELPGANPWQVPPIAGTCPTGYGGTTTNGACKLTQDPLMNTGTEFASAIELPGVNGNPSSQTNPSLPEPGVYYGIVPQTARDYQGVLTASAPWYSASSVGSGVIGLNTTATVRPGYPQRSSLRDCQGAGGSDDAQECVPSLSATVNYPWTCYQNTVQQTTTTMPVTNAGNSTYTPTVGPPTTNATASAVPAARGLPGAIIPLTSEALSGEDYPYTAANGSTFPASYATPSHAPVYGPTTTPLWTTTPAATYDTSWPMTTVHAGSSCTVATQNGSYTTCNDTTSIATIVLAPGQGLENITINVSGETEGSTVSLSASLSSTEGTGSLSFGAGFPLVSSANAAASATSGGVFYADGAGATLTLTLTQSYTPNNPPGIVNFDVTYQTSAVTSTCASPAGMRYNAPGSSPTAYCPTCSGTDSFGGPITYNAGTSTTSCSAFIACPGAYPVQGTVGATTGTCYANCLFSGAGAPAPATPTGFAPTWNPATQMCTYTTCGSNTNGYTKGPAAIGATNYCFQTTCPAAPGSLNTTGTYTNTLPVGYVGAGGPGCTYTCGGSFPNAGTGSNTGKCYQACTLADTGGAAPNGPGVPAGPNYSNGTDAFVGSAATAGSPVNGETSPYCQPQCSRFNGFLAAAANANYPTYNQIGSAAQAAAGTATCDACEIAANTAGAFPAQSWNTANATCEYCGASTFSTTIAAASNGVAVTTGTITVASTTGFPTAGFIQVATSGGNKWVKYTGTNATQFTGCTSNAVAPDTMAMGGAVTAQSLYDITNSAQVGVGGKCDSCAGSSPTTPAYAGYAYECPATSCAANYTLTGPSTCKDTRTCNNSASGSTGGGCPANTGTDTYVCSGADGAAICTDTHTTVTQAANTYTTNPCSAGYNNLQYSNECSNYPGYTNYAGGTCGPSGGPQLISSTPASNCPAGVGGWACEPPSTGNSPQCTPVGPTGGDGYFGNDIIYSFTVPAGTGIGGRYYYHFALLRQGPDGSNMWTGGAPGSTGSVQSQVAPFLYLKTANGFAVNSLASPVDSTYPYSIPALASASDTPGVNAGPDGPVLDCNVAASRTLNGSSPHASDYVVSELDGYLPSGPTPTTYYLVVDNAIDTTQTHAAGYLAPPPAFQYWLQVGAFDDVPVNATTPPTLTQPSYSQMVSQLKGLQAQFVGVENSGLACIHSSADMGEYIAPTTNYAQYETLDFMQKLAYDVGSFDLATNRPYVVSLDPNGNSCNPAPPMATQALGNVASAAWCLLNYPTTAPLYDPSTNACTKGCTTSGDCPMNTPVCGTTAGTCSGANLLPGCCTTPAASCNGVSGLSCAVAAAVGNLTGNLKQNVYLRPIAITAGSTYTAPGASCTPTMLPSSASAQCTAMTGGTSCYGGTCTVTCNAGDPPCASGLCKPSTVPGDNFMPGVPMQYCISPAVFIQSVQAVSNATSQSVCGINTSGLNCGTSATCPTNLPTCLTAGPGIHTCGINDTGPDTIVPQPSYYNASAPPQDNDGMFNLCSPGAQVNFLVTFQMPFQRSADSQQYEFDLGIYAGAGIVGRTRVIIENPALNVASFYRYYNANQACAGVNGGSHVVWGNFSYAAICPQDSAGNYSQIRFCASASSTPMMTTESATAMDSTTTGCEPGEVLLGIATAAPPPNTANLGYTGTCPSYGAPGMGPNAPMTDASQAIPAPYNIGFNVGDVLAANAMAQDAGFASDPYLRIRIEMDPSTPGDAVAPILYSWNLNVDCIPSE